MQMTLIKKIRPVELDSDKYLRRAARYQASETVKRIASKTTPSNAPLTVAIKGSSKPLRDTGLLQNSIAYRVEGNTAIIGTNRIGARLQNEGGTIKPKKARKLWIPANKKVRAMLRNAGTITALIKKLNGQGYGCFRRGKAFMYCKKGEKPEVLFILKDSVVIPARPFLYFTNDDIKAIGKIMKEVVVDDSADS